MGAKLKFFNSSFLVSLPVLLGSAGLAGLAAFFGYRPVALLLAFLCLLAALSRVWALLSARRLTLRMSVSDLGLFPGDTARFEGEIRNDKFFPVLWMGLFLPLAQNLCLTPDQCRKPDDREALELQELKAADTTVGWKSFSSLLWYDRVTFSIQWTANCRGLYSTEHWQLRTGDGFGLTQMDLPLPADQVCTFAVYPRLIPVSTHLFLRNLWNADTGSRGVMEDQTVIRSTRDYQTSDSLKHINWRLAARGLPLTVNIFEDILPKGVHFLLDGESFSGKTPHLEALEDTLSILASEVVCLEEAQVHCGLSLCQGAANPARNLFGGGPEGLLRALAAYQPLEPRYDDKEQLVPQTASFQETGILEGAQRVGRFYYVTYGISALAAQKLPRQLGPSRLSILTYGEAVPFGEFEVVSLSQLKEGRGHG